MQNKWWLNKTSVSLLSLGMVIGYAMSLITIPVVLGTIIALVVVLGLIFGAVHFYIAYKQQDYDILLAKLKKYDQHYQYHIEGERWYAEMNISVFELMDGYTWGRFKVEIVEKDSNYTVYKCIMTEFPPDLLPAELIYRVHGNVTESNAHYSILEYPKPQGWKSVRVQLPGSAEPALQLEYEEPISLFDR
jgi:hypothetical protein